MFQFIVNSRLGYFEKRLENGLWYVRNFDCVVNYI